MREESWPKMFVIALVLHAVLLAAFSVPLRRAVRKIDLSYYSVNLVTDVPGPAASAGKAAARIPPAAKKIEPPAPPRKAEAKEAAKAKPIPQPKEKERSIAPTKMKTAVTQKKEAPDTETASSEEVSTLDEKIREMRRRTQYMDVGKGSGVKGAGGDAGLPSSAAGGARPLDPALQRYYLDVWERIRALWRPPGLSGRKNLETVVSVRIRKDGRIVDWQMEERSGDRVFDESVARTLRAIDMLPPIPASLNLEDIEIGFNFHP